MSAGQRGEEGQLCFGATKCECVISVVVITSNQHQDKIEDKINQ